MIDIKKIDPSPYQHRKYFDEESLKEFGANILRDGLIEPIVVRPQKKDRFQLIAGERRLRAIKDYTDIMNIQAKIAAVDDLQAQRISTAENLEKTNKTKKQKKEAPQKEFSAQIKVAFLCLIPWQAGVWLQIPALHLTEDAGLLIF